MSAGAPAASGAGALRRLLWVDGAAGAAVGIAVIALAGPLSDLEGLPRGLLLATGAANGLYACYSLSLALRDRASRRSVTVLAAANGAWAVVCLGLVVAFGPGATAFGVAHLAGEAAFVGGLAVLEWRHRPLARTSARR